jgi:hypothetical protein
MKLCSAGSQLRIWNDRIWLRIECHERLQRVESDCPSHVIAATRATHFCGCPRQCPLCFWKQTNGRPACSAAFRGRATSHSLSLASDSASRGGVCYFFCLAA